MLRATALVLLGVTLAAPIAAAQSKWEDQVATYIKRAAHVLEDNGYARTQKPYTGTLREGESEDLTITLHSGTTYAMVGVCDNDCTDIDFRLFDADDNEVDSDLKTDDYPLVKVTPGETMRYRLKIIMVTCKTSPCFYGVGVFSKDN
jgi:hypothetical protein